MAEGAPRKEFVWDGATRLFHWIIVGLFALSWWTAEEGMMDWHFRSGMLLFALLVFRLYWGVAGPRTSRFASFIKGPRAIFGYASSLFSREHKLFHGHNPLGALSVIAIILALVGQVGLGLFASDTDGLYSGPLSRFVSYETAVAAAEIHETLFNVLLVLIGLHIAAIAFYLVVKRANLIGPMLTGRRTVPPEDQTAEPMQPAPLWRLLLGIAIAGIATWLVFPDEITSLLQGGWWDAPYY